MVEHHKPVDQIVEEALAIFVDTEGMNTDEQDAIREALEWAIHQARGF